MSAITSTPEPREAASRGQGPWRRAVRRFRADRLGLAAAVVVLSYLVLILAAALGAVAGDWQQEKGISYATPFFIGHAYVPTEGSMAGDPKRMLDPGATEVDLTDIDPLAPYYGAWRARTAQIEVKVAPRNSQLPLGGDKWGRDVLSKVIKGGQTSILVGLVAAILATVIGTLLGAISGFFGGLAGDALEWVYNVFTAIPFVLLILAFAAVLHGGGLSNVVVVLSLTGWTGIYRQVRSEYLKHRNRDYVRAAEAIGAGAGRRMFGHILPNVAHVILVQLSLHVVQFIKAEVILSFLGLGVGVDEVSWGTMLAEAQSEMVIGVWWQLASAGAAMAIFVTAFSLLTDALRDALDPHLA